MTDFHDKVNELILTERQSRMAENYMIWCEIERLASNLNADDFDETFGFSIRSKDSFLTRIREARGFIPEIWEEIGQ